jgi:hypothetical protein
MLWFFSPFKSMWKKKKKKKVEAFPKPSDSYETSYFPILHQKHFLLDQPKCWAQFDL